MRLIDADEFKKQIAGMAVANNYPADKANKICKLVDCQKTAYDVDAVVKGLEERLCSKQKEYTDWDCAMRNKHYEDAIGIVKSGGTEK